MINVMSVLYQPYWTGEHNSNILSCQEKNYKNKENKINETNGN